MDETLRIPTRSIIDRIRAAPSPDAPAPHPAPTGELTHAEIEIIRNVSLAITASLDIDQTLDTIAEKAAQLVHASASMVYLFDRQNGMLKLMTGFRIPESYVGLSLRPNEDAPGRAAANSRPLIVDNFASWKERAAVFQEAAPQGPRWNAHCVAALPIIFRQQVLAVLEVLYTDEREITNTDIALLQLIIPHAATAIAHAQLFERNQHVMSLLELINDRSAAISSVSAAVVNAGHNLARMSEEALTRAVAALRLAGGQVFLSDNRGQSLHAVASQYLELEADEPGFIRVAQHCATVRQTILLQNMTSFPWTHEVVRWLDDHHLGPMVCVPLVAEDEVVGVLQIIALPGKEFGTGELDTLHIITGQLALGVANAYLFRRIQAEQQQMAAILSSSGDAIIGLDATGQVQLANPAAERAFEFAAHESIGRQLREVTPNVALNSGVDTALKSDEIEPSAFEVPLADGAILFCNLSPIVDPAGQLSGWVAVMQDITHFKEIERMKSDMILTASHDLRNPVNLALGALDLLGKRVDNFNEVQREALGLALMGVRRIEALIKDLLDLERIERRVGLKLTRCDMREITRTVVTELRLTAQQRQQQLDYTPPSSKADFSVRGDAQRLYQVTSNLVSNALKYTQPGGTITVVLRVQDGEVRFEVRDTGAGISPEAQSRVFERFYRAPTVATDDRGTGLGLAIVKSIVEQHGGRVWVNSVVGQGSTFSVALPCWRGDVAESPPAEAGRG